MIVIHEVAASDAPIALLLTADPDRKRIAQYLAVSRVFIGVLVADTAGVLVWRMRNRSEAEIMNLAVTASHQRTGIGSTMIGYAVTCSKVAGATHLLVSTGNSSLGELRFYQRLRFRISGVSPIYFVDDEPPIFENGLRSLDLIHLSRAL